MLDRQFSEPCAQSKLKSPSVPALWLVPNNLTSKSITKIEEYIASQLPEQFKRQFLHTRGHAREALSELWKTPALEIPLTALPGKPPELANDWGCVSFSHCRDALLIGWSNSKIGIDIERKDRVFSAKLIARKYFDETEKNFLSTLSNEQYREAVLEKWILKEAAIKWQRGSIANDLRHWQSNQISNEIRHRKKGYRLKGKLISYSDWLIAIASENIDGNTIICNYN